MVGNARYLALLAELLVADGIHMPSLREFAYPLQGYRTHAGLHGAISVEAVDGHRVYISARPMMRMNNKMA